MRRFRILLGATWLAAILLGAYSLSPAIAQAPQESADDAEARPAPPKRKKYRKSKLTYDETEALADRRRLLLTTGEDRSVDLDFDANLGPNGISIGNPQVVATTLVKIGEKKQLVFKPLKSGETTVSVRDGDGNLRLIFTVRVTGSNLLRVAGEIRNLLRDVEGIDIRVVGSKIAIEGEVLVPSDYAKYVTVIQDSSYDKLVIPMVSLSPLAMQVLAKKIQDDVNTFASNVKTRVVNGVIFLEGTVDSKDHADRAAKVAFLYLPELRPNHPLEQAKEGVLRLNPPRSLIQNFIVINPPPPRKAEKLVRVTVHFVELSKDYTRFFGFKWQPGFTFDPQIQVGQTQTGGVGSSGVSFTGTISSLFPKLDSAQKAGYARILKTGTLIVRSGQPAKLDERTQIPVMVPTGNGQAMASSVPVGLVVAVTPMIVGQSDDIQLDLNMNQINLVGKEGSAPLTSNHAVETKLYVKSGESAAVAGVTSSDVGTDFNKNDPKRGSFEDASTNALFTLLRTKNYHKKKSQFVIFVTPNIIENASEGTEDLKKNFRVKVN